MNLYAEIDQEFEHFVEFGQLFDRKTRRYLVAYILCRISGQEQEPFETESRYFHYLTKALDRILSGQQLFKVLRDHPALSRQIADDLIRWIRKTDRKITEDNPWHQELQTLQAWSQKPAFMWKTDWYMATNFLKNEYAFEQIDVAFYVGKFKELAPQAPANPAEERALAGKRTDFELVIEDLLAQWDSLLSAKIVQYMAELLEKESETFGQLLQSKIEEYAKLMQLINPFAEEAGRFWDLSKGLWKKTSFNVLDRYQELLRNEQSIRELADLLGRMREAEIELEEETIQEVIERKEWVSEPLLPQELVGLQGSNNLNLMLPAEAALLADDSTASAFYQKFADHSLLSFRYEGKKLVSSDRISFYSQQKQKKKEKGPFIICVDTSGSMEGLPAQIAKVLTFAIMKMAAKEQRKCFLISFSIGIKTISLHDIASSMDKIIEFLSMSFDGGTDVTPALSAALDLLQTSDYREADVLMISDFVMFGIREDLLERLRSEQHKGTCFHSLTLSQKPNISVIEAFDNYWVYDPEHKQVLRRMLEDLRTVAAQPQRNQVS